MTTTSHEGAAADGPLVSASDAAPAPACGGGPTPEVAAYLTADDFPCTHDELLAVLIRKRVPSRLLACLATAPPARRYDSPAALLAQIGAPG